MTAQNLQDIADVRALIQLYVEGSNGDGDKMRQAFHPDAHMFGHIGGMDTYEPITDFTKLVESQPGLAGPNYRADIRTVDLVGDAASRSSSRRITSVATSSTISRLLASTGAGGSRTRRTPTRAELHRRADAKRRNTGRHRPRPSGRSASEATRQMSVALVPVAIAANIHDIHELDRADWMWTTKQCHSCRSTLPSQDSAL